MSLFRDGNSPGSNEGGAPGGSTGCRLLSHAGSSTGGSALPLTAALADEPPAPPAPLCLCLQQFIGLTHTLAIFTSPA